MRAWRGMLLGLLLAAVFGGEAARAVPAVTGRRTVVRRGTDPLSPCATDRIDAARSARSPHRAPEVAPIRRETVALGPRVSTPLATRDGTLYVPTEGGLVVLGPDVRERFRMPGEPVLETPTLLPDGDVAFATAMSTLVVVGPDGTVRRRRVLAAPAVHSLLALPDGALCFVQRDLVFRCDEPDGRTRFASRLHALPSTDPALASDGSILLAVGDELVRLDELGTELRRTHLGAAVSAGPVVSPGGVVHLLTYAAELVSVELASGRTRRRLLALRPGGAGGLYASGDGGLVIAVPGGPLLSLDERGSERFRSERRGTFGPAGILDAEGTFLGVNQDGILHALAPDGRERWRIELGERTDAAPILLPDGTLVVPFRSGSLSFWRPPCASTSSTSNCPRN